MVVWLAVDTQGRVAAFEIGDFGARPARALRLDAVEPELRAGWYDADGARLLRFTHVAAQPGGIYARSGGEGTVTLDDLPDDVVAAVEATCFPIDLSATDVVDLVQALPETLLLGQEENREAPSPLELPELFQVTGKRMRLGTGRKNKKDDDDS